MKISYPPAINFRAISVRINLFFLELVLKKNGSKFEREPTVYNNGGVGETNDRERFFSENFQKSRGMNYHNFPDMNLSVGCVLFQI